MVWFGHLELEEQAGHYAEGVPPAERNARREAGREAGAEDAHLGAVERAGLTQRSGMSQGPAEDSERTGAALMTDNGDIQEK